MFVDYLCVDDVNDPPPSEVPDVGETTSPSWDDIERAVRSLDGDEIRLVIISERPPDDDTGWPVGGLGMLIGGGGENGLYVCRVLSDKDDKVYHLSMPEKDKLGWQEIMCGQPVDFEGAFCVTLDSVLNAAKEFAMEGRLVDSEVWTRRHE